VGALTLGDRLRQGGDDIQIEGLAAGARLLGALEHGDGLDGLRKRRQEMLR
jgi:hypothetical protein